MRQEAFDGGSVVKVCGCAELSFVWNDGHWGRVANRLGSRGEALKELVFPRRAAGMGF